jgi:hypothetical protein
MHFNNAIIGWKPNCEIDGTYSARQCRGDKITGRLEFIFVLHRYINEHICLDVSVMQKVESKFLAGIGGEMQKK